MPVVIASLASGIASVVVQMLFKVIANPVFIRKVLLMAAEKLVALTPTDADDKILALAEKILAEDDAKV